MMWSKAKTIGITYVISKNQAFRGDLKELKLKSEVWQLYAWEGDLIRMFGTWEWNQLIISK